jgi:hypothetical protein
VLYRWPSDPPGKAASHPKPYAQYVNEKKARDQDAGNAIAQYGANYVSPGQAIKNYADQWAKDHPEPGPPAAAAPPEAPAAPRQFAPDSTYNNDTAFNRKTYDDTISGLDDAERVTKFQYDDPTNPYSRVATSKREFLQRGTGITNSLAARGQTFSGAHTRQLANNRYNEEQSAAGMKAAYEAALAEIKAGRTRAGTALEGADLEAWKAAMTRQGLS